MGSATLTATTLDAFVDQVGNDDGAGGAGLLLGTVAATNIALSGNAEADHLRGAEGVDQIVHGNGGNDTIISSGEGHYFGDAGNDMVFAGLSSGLPEVLDGGAGTDTLDTTSFTGDYVINMTTGATHFGFESFVNFENLITGSGADSITGTSGANNIQSGDGNDTLNGGGGNDVLSGLGGNDIYIVDAAGDVVIEASGGGSDRVFASVSYTLGAGQEVEILSTINNAGVGAINLTGNGFTNSIIGNAGTNVLNGGGGADVLSGLGGNDTIRGDAGGDTLDGGTGLDTLSYAGSSLGVFVRLFNNTAFGGDAGGDTIAGFENALGSSQADDLRGSNGANVLYGALGNDTLYGQAGTDAFRFTTALGAGNVDTIADYSVADDTVQLDAAVFTGLAAGALAAGAFRTGAAAADADDRIVYNSATGALLFDADGNGAGAAVQFATLSAGLAMAAGEFTVI